MIPIFRNDGEAQAYAERHRPRDQALGPLGEDYGLRYGARAARAAQGCRDAFARGDTRGLHVHGRALALILFTDHPQLFEHRRRSSACDAKAQEEKRK